MALGSLQGVSGQTVTEFPIPTAGSLPQGITAGPDGNLWFVENAGGQIGRITTGAGEVTPTITPTITQTPTITPTVTLTPPVTPGGPTATFTPTSTLTPTPTVTTGTGGPGIPANIPTLGPLTLAILALALAGIGYLVLRSRS